MRRGARTLEFVRLLDNDTKVQFEDQLTRQVHTMRLSRFYAGVLAKQLLPVLAEEARAADPSSANRSPALVTDLSSLADADRTALERRMTEEVGAT